MRSRGWGDTRDEQRAMLRTDSPLFQ